MKASSNIDEMGIEHLRKLTVEAVNRAGTCLAVCLMKATPARENATPNNVKEFSDRADILREAICELDGLVSEFEQLSRGFEVEATLLRQSNH